MKLIFSLAASAMPGLLRIYLVWLLALLLPPDQSAALTTNFLLATALCMFTGGGFGLVLLRQIADASRQSQLVTSSLLLATGVIISCVIGWIAAVLLNANIVQVIILVIALSIWQIERHGWIAQRKFVLLCTFDTALALAITLAAIFTTLDLIANLLVSHLLCTILSVVIRTRLWSLSGSEERFQMRFIINGLQIGTTNFISGGFLFILPSLVDSMLSSILLAKLNLAVTAIGALFIIPRSYLNLFMGTLARLAHRQKVHSLWVRTCIKRVRFVSAAMLAPAICFVLLYSAISGYKIETSDIILVTLMCAAMVSGQLYLVESNLLVLLKRENVTLVASLLIFIVLTGLALGLVRLEVSGYSLLFFIFICLAVAYICRWVFFAKILSRYLKPRVSGA